MSARKLTYLRAWHVGLRHHARSERWIMGAAPIADDLDPLHRGCLTGCHCGSLICSIHHEVKQSGLTSIQQDGRHRADTESLPIIVVISGPVMSGTNHATNPPAS